jgi:hypothetical protein
MGENSSVLHVAQHERNLSENFSSGAGISERDEVRTFTRTKHANAELSFVSHAGLLQTEPQKAKEIFRAAPVLDCWVFFQ